MESVGLVDAEPYPAVTPNITVESEDVEVVQVIVAVVWVGEPAESDDNTGPGFESVKDTGVEVA